MQFQRLNVQNWRCFEEESVRFEDGVTVLHGNNGSGKSSLLEAAFFALYGTDAFDTGTNMDDVVTTDEDTAEVTLSFAHRGESYEVTREIRIRASTYQEAELTTPPGQPDLEQTGPIDELIQEELRLNAEDFLNSAYVRQGDVTRLIEATPRQRQRIIDNLLQMSKLERYRERMDSIETGVGRVLNAKNNQIEELNGQIEKYDEPRIRSRKKQLEAFEDELDGKRSSINERIEELEAEQEEAEQTVREQTDLEEEVSDTESDVRDRMEDLQAEITDYQNIQTTLTEAETEVEKACDELEDLLGTGNGGLTDDYSEGDAVIAAINESAQAVVSDFLGSTDKGENSQQGNGDVLEDDPPDVAASILNGDTGETSDEIQTSDDLLSDLSAAIPPVSPAVTDETVNEETVTIGTTDAFEKPDIDPIINPNATVQQASVRVPAPDLDADPETLEIETAVDTHDHTREIVSDIRQRLQALEDAAEEARSEGDQLARKAQEHSRDAESALEEASNTLSEIADIRYAQDKLEQRRQDFRTRLRDSQFDVDPEKDNPRDALKTLIEQLDSRINRLEAERNHHSNQASELNGQISRADELLDEGNCPQCGQPVEGAPEVQHLDEWKKQRANHQKLVEELAGDIEELTTSQQVAEELVEQATGLFGDDQISTISFSGPQAPEGPIDPTIEIRPLQEEAADHHLQARDEQRSARQKRAKAVKKHLTANLLKRAAERTLAHLYRALARQNLLRQIEEATDDRTDAERDRDLAESQLDSQATDVTEAHSDLQETVQKHSEVTNEFNPEMLEQARQIVEETQTELENLTDDLEDLRDTERAVSGHLGDLGQQLTQLKELRTERDTRKRESEAVSALNDQVAELESMFVNLRADLRQQNVNRLEELLKEMFGTLYRNNAYADIELGKDYDATLIEKGGGKLPPSKLSGGESAVFNLALRGAIYRLLTEGFEDDVPMPPLILDEPTAHLDAGHVDRLDDVVEAMRTAGVEQTIVVSHDEELIDSADQRIEVRQQQGTNRSVAEADTGITLGL